MFSILIYPLNRRDVGTANKVGAYLLAFMDSNIVVKFVNNPVRILCAMIPKHKKFVVDENGQNVADRRSQQALYIKSETLSPTVATAGALMLSILIYAHGR